MRMEYRKIREVEAAAEYVTRKHKRKEDVADHLIEKEFVGGHRKEKEITVRIAREKGRVSEKGTARSTPKQRDATEEWCGRREDEEGCIEICDNCKSPWGTGINPFIIINVLIIIPYLIIITIKEPLSFQQSQNDFFLMIRGTLCSNQTTHWGHAHGELPGRSLCFYSHIDQQNICINVPGVSEGA